MKVLNLTDDSKLYTSNVFLVMGTWNTIDDVTTLVDVGSDQSIIGKIENINTGLGKRKIDQVVLTHSHSDHSAMLASISENFKPRVCAFNSHLKGIDQVLRDGDLLRIGEKQFEVYHLSAHSHDSICLFCDEDGVLFAGDTTFPIEFENEQMYRENEDVIRRLRTKHVTRVYSGHGPPHDFKDVKFKVIKNRDKY